METFYKEIYVVNVLKCNTFKHWKKIKIGNRVTFEVYAADDKNISKDVDIDKDLIRVILTHDEDEVLKEKPTIGMLSEEEGKLMKDIIKNKWKDFFEGTICKIDEKAQYDQRISLAVYIKPNKDCHTLKK